MSVSRTSVFEQTVPHRPATADVLNGSKTNSTSTVPANLPSAEEFEQMAALLVAYGRMLPLLRFVVTFAGIVPSVAAFASVRGDAVGIDFTITRIGAGDIEIAWTTAKYPTLGTAAVSLNVGAAANHRAPDAVMTTPSAGLTGVRIRTKDSAGAAADVPFTVQVF